MNTGKQINAMVVVLLVLLIAVGAYALFDPFRSDAAKDTQLDKASERGATTFALNCRLCHGDRGQGGAAGGRLPAAADLDRDTLQGINNGAYTQADYDTAFRHVRDTITCGRVDTPMPAWSDKQGGTLNDEQVRQLAVLITKAQWDLAQEHADEIDAETTGHATVQMPNGPLGPDETTLIVSNAGHISLGEYIRIKNEDGESEERMRVLPKAIVVDRSVDGTEAADHERGIAVLSSTGQPVLSSDGETEQTLTEAAADDAPYVVVPDTEQFAVGDVLQLEDERVRVTAIVTGIPSTGQKLAKDIGREPRNMIVTGSAGIEVGQIVRMDSELFEVQAITDDGNPKITVDADVTSSADQVSVDNPVFLSKGYTFRVDDEWMRVVDPVDTEQTLSDTIGRAQTTFGISGTAGIDNGMVIRMGSELMRVEEIISPATIEVERGQDSDAASHAAGVTFFEQVPPPEGSADDVQAAYEETEQSLLDPVGPEDTELHVTGTAGLSVDGTFQLDGELVTIVDIKPAQVRVQREFNGTERVPHPRRSPIYNGNLLEVERGFNNTGAASHTAGSAVAMTQLQMNRQQQGSELEDHAKNAELFLDNQLIVQRGVRNTTAAEHQNGSLVYDFPPPPDEPALNQGACGYVTTGGSSNGAQPTAIPGATAVAVGLAEWTVAPDPTSVAAGPVAFNVTNDGTTVHNFRVIQTDLPADQLPVANDQVDESQLNVLASIPRVNTGDTQGASAELTPGNYVLICNVGGHYDQGMYTGFQVQ